jgi:hypothetical protein
MGWFFWMIVGYALGQSDQRTYVRAPRRPVQLDFGFPRSYKPGSDFNYMGLALAALLGMLLVPLVAPPILAIIGLPMGAVIFGPLMMGLVGAWYARHQD